MRRAKSLLRRGHYWLGLGLALPLVMLAVTGILLNHTGDLRLDQHYSRQPWLLQLYGISPATPDKGYRLDRHWVSKVRNSIWLDDKKLAATTAPLQGAALLGDLLVIAEPMALRLYTQNGRPVERLDLPTRIGPIRAIAVADQRLLLRGADRVFSTDANFSQWRRYTKKWPGNPPQALPDRLRQQITQQLTAHTLTWEKILLDTHSGRIFGAWGPLFVDLVAIITLALAVTGCLLWTLQRRRKKQNQRPT